MKNLKPIQIYTKIIEICCNQDPDAVETALDFVRLHMESRAQKAPPPDGSIPIEKVMFSKRTANLAKLLGIAELQDFVYLTEFNLLVFPNFGRKSLNEVKQACLEAGIILGSRYDQFEYEKINENKWRYEKVPEYITVMRERTALVSNNN